LFSGPDFQQQAHNVTHHVVQEGIGSQIQHDPISLAFNPDEVQETPGAV
jgi:hypothetical protein